MRKGSELFELKLHELHFLIKKLEIHNKLHAEAALSFSNSFKNYIESVDDRTVRHKLKQIAGLAGENEKPMTKTAKRAKQSAQYRKGKSKMQESTQQEQHQAPPPPQQPSSNKVPSEYKSLYRRVAQKLHPDKIGNDEAKAAMLQEVNSAIATGDFFKIIEHAIKLKIDIPDEVPLDLNELEVKIESKKKKIKDLTKSVAWEWYYLDSEEKKQKLMHGYANYLINNK